MELILAAVVIFLLIRHGYHKIAQAAATHTAKATKKSAQLIKESGVLGEVKAQFRTGNPVFINEKEKSRATQDQ